MAPDYDALSDGSDLTGEDSASDHHQSSDEAMPSALRTPSKKRRRIVRAVADDDDDEDADEVADALEDDQLDDEEEDNDELDDEEEEEEEEDEDYDAPSSSRRTASRSSGRKSAASTRSAAATSTPKRSARSSARTATANSTPTASASKKSLRVKLTRTPNTATAAKEDSSPAIKGRTSRAAAASTPPSHRAKDSSKVKWKPRTSKSKDYSDDEDDDEIPTHEDDELDEGSDGDLDRSLAPTRDGTLSNSDSDDDDGDASEPDEATAAEMAAIIGKTARQLAREGGVESEHMELPMFDPNRKKKLTENEIALRRSETARKRKNQVEKKLEDDKVETINRLLKKQVGRSRNKLPRAGSAEDSDEEAEQARKRGREELSRKALKEMPTPFFRLIDRADGKVLGVPTGPPLVEEVWGSNYVEVNQALIQQLDEPIKEEKQATLAGKAKILEERARKRLAEQGQQWKQDHALEQVWGQEGLYEYKLRSALGQSRKDWIGSRRPPTPEQEEQTEEQAAEEQDEQAAADGEHQEQADDADSK
ncbi:uncharacterized protein UTRI_04847_B [Ustilago trichophora]|uniref:INO80 complex subunit B-like conserved region domain-containing protein n=1 Tax=Ustilago trichophora TaxID=86804 RepID=A0A5C3EH91_9BASI|nr:uncharacterized protein UTRI_04847_B [Ustilago trichophora]